MIDRQRRAIEGAHRRRRILIKAMGGKCDYCGATESLEFHHIEPRTWIGSKKSRWQRHVIHEEEYEAGKLKLACPDCNKKLGVPGWETEGEPF